MKKITFEEWWKKNVTPEFAQDALSYYNLTKEKIKDLAVEADLIDDLTEDIDITIKSSPFVSYDPSKRYLEFTFSWTKRNQEQPLFEKSLGIFEYIGTKVKI